MINRSKLIINYNKPKLHASNNRNLKYMNKNLIKLKLEMHKLTISARDFNTAVDN